MSVCLVRINGNTYDISSKEMDNIRESEGGVDYEVLMDTHRKESHSQIRFYDSVYNAVNAIRKDFIEPKNLIEIWNDFSGSEEDNFYIAFVDSRDESKQFTDGSIYFQMYDKIENHTGFSFLE